MQILNIILNFTLYPKKKNTLLNPVWECYYTSSASSRVEEREINTVFMKFLNRKTRGINPWWYDDDAAKVRRPTGAELPRWGLMRGGEEEVHCKLSVIILTIALSEGRRLWWYPEDEARRKKKCRLLQESQQIVLLSVYRTLPVAGVGGGGGGNSSAPPLRESAPLSPHTRRNFEQLDR